MRTYWKEAAPSRAMISSTILRKASTGNVSGLGWPGANEMIPGFSMSALIRRMAEKRMPRAALENRSSHAVAVFSVIPSSLLECVRCRTNAAVYAGLAGAQARPRHRTAAGALRRVSWAYGRHRACNSLPWPDGGSTIAWSWRTGWDAAARWAFAAAARVRARPRRRPPSTRRSSSRLRRIETAFRSGEAGSLRPAFTAQGKVRVDLKDVMEGPGSYGPSQLEVIFGRIFDENRTRQFVFRDEDVTVTDSGGGLRARALAAQGERRRDPTPPDTVTFTLRQESGDWRIHEIRSSR